MNMAFISVAFILLSLASCKKDNGSNVIITPPTKTPTKTPQYTVYDEGVSGNTSADLVARLDPDVIALKPSLVTIMIGTNDVRQNVPLSTYTANLTTLITSILAVHGKVLLLSPPPHGRDTIKSTDPINNKTDTIATILDSLSKQYNCYYYDMNSAFKNAGSPNPTAASMIRNFANFPSAPDGIHLTPAGMTFVAANIFDFLKNNQLLNYYTIVCFGDSITHQGGDESYPSQLQQLLKNN